MVVAILALIAGLLGTAIAAVPVTKKKVNKIITNRAPGLTVGTANNANALGGQGASAFQTASASDVRSNVVAMGSSNVTVLSTNITTPAAKTLTAVASVEALADGGAEGDNINCNINIDGTDGARQTTYVTPNELDDSTTLPLTQALAVGAGPHTVIVECSEGSLSNTSVEDRSLSVVATG
jgi:hypothetical protein